MYAPPMALVVERTVELTVGALTLLNWLKKPVIHCCFFNLYFKGASTTTTSSPSCAGAFNEAVVLF
jgi:hypothetical protein